MGETTDPKAIEDAPLSSLSLKRLWAIGGIGFVLVAAGFGAGTFVQKTINDSTVLEKDREIAALTSEQTTNQQALESIAHSQEARKRCAAAPQWSARRALGGTRRA